LKKATIVAITFFVATQTKTKKGNGNKLFTIAFFSSSKKQKKMGNEQQACCHHLVCSKNNKRKKM
jgi:hypothetical protein